MDQYDLEAALLKMGLDESAFSIGRLKEEALILLSESRLWKVFYLERGYRRNEQSFDTLDAACRHFVKRVESWRGIYNGLPY